MKKNLILLFLVLIGCNRFNHPDNASLKSITSEDLVKHIKVLASDEFEGREMATAGEEKTINYLKAEFEKLGLKPGNTADFFQPIDIFKITSKPDNEIIFNNANRQNLRLRYYNDFVITSPQITENISLKNAELVFVGYGVTAPEYNWNDFDSVDVKNKVIIVLVNDPGYHVGDTTLFNGKALTYYGRWSYKFEEAARRGAAGVLIIHQTEAAGYPWSVITSSWGESEFYQKRLDDNKSMCSFTGWLTTEKASELFKLAGLNLDEEIKAASTKDFKAKSLGLTLSLRIKNKIQNLVSNNVIGLLPGTTNPDEYIIYMAHWDHFGINKDFKGDQIINGARDNATGVAALLEIAEAFAKAPKKPQRSIIFLAVTGEESGLLGSKFYADNPIYSLNKTVAVINMDGLNIWGRMKDVTSIGYGLSELDSYIADAAAEQDRIVNPDPEPQDGGFFRSDHFSFVKKGVPAVCLSSGTDHVKFGRKWTLTQMLNWTKENYHKPSDEYNDTWNLDGAVDDTKLNFIIGYTLSMKSDFANFYETTPYKKIREASLEE